MIDIIEAPIKIYKAPPMIKLAIHIIMGIILISITYNNSPRFINDILYIPINSNGFNTLWGFNFSCSLIYITTFFSTLYNIWARKFVKKLRSSEFNELYNDFHSDNMRMQLKKIYDWKRSNPEEGKYGKLYRSNKENTDFDNVHSIRGIVYDRYRKILRYYYLDHTISKSEVKVIVTPDRIKILLDTIEPLEKEIGDKYDQTVFKFYRKLYKLNFMFRLIKKMKSNHIT